MSKRLIIISAALILFGAGCAGAEQEDDRLPIPPIEQDEQRPPNVEEMPSGGCTMVEVYEGKTVCINKSQGPVAEEMIRIKLFDESNQPLRQKDVVVKIDGCGNLAPCGADVFNKEWKGKTDNNGYIVIPSTFQYVASFIQVSGYPRQTLELFVLNNNEWKMTIRK